jgi:PucR C-terminal helix-turn-helix domain
MNWSIAQWVSRHDGSGQRPQVRRPAIRTRVGVLVMVQTVAVALDGFGDLPDEEREMLFGTFRVWPDNDTSVRGAAEVLICHPNTVRHRLRRIEEHTGRSLSRPKDIAELCLPFEVHRRLM